MKISSGPNKGFYYIPTPYTTDNSLVRNETVYSRLRLSPGKGIHGFNKSYLPYINGYYYVPRNDEMDIRKVIYGLENKEIPSTGNTETFMREFEHTILVPDEWCPHYLDPCDYDWCKRCDALRNPKVIKKPELTSTKQFFRRIYVFGFMLILSFILILAIRS
jgi:hypothetical protein